MKETIYLLVDARGVQGMRKSLTTTKRGEVCVKLNIEMPAKAFNPPMLEQTVVINDWRDGIDLEDVQFRNSVITEEEAEVIRQRRLEKMKEVLESQGYKVEKEVSDE